MAIRQVILSNKRYTEEFKIEAVRQVVNRGYSVAEVAQRLGTTTHSLYAWKKLYGPDSTEHREKTASEQEIRRLKKELRRATEERDILKKAAVSSTGHRNSGIEFIGRRFVFQCFSRSLIEPSSDFV